MAAGSAPEERGSEMSEVTFSLIKDEPVIDGVIAIESTWIVESSLVAVSVAFKHRMKHLSSQSFSKNTRSYLIRLSGSTSASSSRA